MPTPDPPPTSAQQLANLEKQYWLAAQAQNLGKGDRHLMRVNLAELWQQILNWREQVALDSGQGGRGGVAYAAFQPPQ